VEPVNPNVTILALLRKEAKRQAGLELGAKVKRWHNYPRSNRYPFDYFDWDYQNDFIWGDN
jgi:hypothetical protein